jgi:hypothetical protein
MLVLVAGAPIAAEELPGTKVGPVQRVGTDWAVGGSCLWLPPTDSPRPSIGTCSIAPRCSRVGRRVSLGCVFIVRQCKVCPSGVGKEWSTLLKMLTIDGLQPSTCRITKDASAGRSRGVHDHCGQRSLDSLEPADILDHSYRPAATISKRCRPDDSLALFTAGRNDCLGHIDAPWFRNWRGMSCEVAA